VIDDLQLAKRDYRTACCKDDEPMLGNFHQRGIAGSEHELGGLASFVGKSKEIV
jgi:hypothetical protein